MARSHTRVPAVPMKLSSYRFVLVCVIPLILISCAYQYESLRPAERLLHTHHIDSVVVMPFLNLSEGPGDVSEISEIFTSELGRFRELQIIHPAAVRQYLAENDVILSPKNIRQQALRVGTFFNVQSVIIGVVTEHNAFYPPRCGLSFELISIRTGDTIATKSETYDSSFNYVRNELKEYASTKKIDDSLYREDLILHRFSLYLRFVCHQFIKKYF